MIGFAFQGVPDFWMAFAMMASLRAMVTRTSLCGLPRV